MCSATRIITVKGASSKGGFNSTTAYNGSSTKDGLHRNRGATNAMDAPGEPLGRI